MADLCHELVPCGVDSPCEYEGAEMDEMDNYTMSCIRVDTCGGAVCIWDGEACMLECGTDECNMMESYPLQVGCPSFS